MHVESAAALIALGDTGELQVAIEDPDESIGDVEDRHAARQAARDGLASPVSFRLERGELVAEPGPKVGGEVVTNDDVVSFAVLLVGDVEIEVWDRPIKPELSDAQTRKLILSQSAEHQRFVNQRSLSADRFEPLPNIGLHFGDRLPFPMPPSNCHRFE